MKKLSIYFFLVGLIFVLSSCPESTSVPLASKGTVKLEKTLIGTWETDDLDINLEKFTVSQNDQFSYKVAADIWDDITEDTETEYYIAWLVPVNDQKFVVAQKTVDNKTENTFYLYNYKFENGKLVLQSLNIESSVLSNIKTSEEYMKTLKSAMAKGNFLTSEGTYTRQ